MFFLRSLFHPESVGGNWTAEQLSQHIFQHWNVLHIVLVSTHELLDVGLLQEEGPHLNSQRSCAEGFLTDEGTVVVHFYVLPNVPDEEPNEVASLFIELLGLERHVLKELGAVQPDSSCSPPQSQP